MNVLGYISIYASTIYAATLILGATCSIGSDGVYVATKYQNYGMFAATTFLTFGMTCVSSELLNKLNMSYIFIQFAMLLALIIALAAGTPSELKNSASFVFTDFENTSYGWNNGWAFMLSFLTPVWVVSGFESSATIAEGTSYSLQTSYFLMGDLRSRELSWELRQNTKRVQDLFAVLGTARSSGAHTVKRSFSLC
jgi:hypothetical protein